MKASNKSLKVWVASFMLCGGAAGTVVAEESGAGIFSSPFDDCFAAGYNLSEVSPEQAFATAQCFTSLLDGSREELDMAALGASEHTIMEYAASWYSAAQDRGHQLAEVYLEANLSNLSLVEHRAGTRVQGPQLMASEQKFHALDLDDNGELSLQEASSSSEIKMLFASSDFGSDGSLSFGEYAILSGEPTAAGN